MYFSFGLRELKSLFNICIMKEYSYFIDGRDGQNSKRLVRQGGHGAWAGPKRKAGSFRAEPPMTDLGLSSSIN
jgi:hypothetical protein